MSTRSVVNKISIRILDLTTSYTARVHEHTKTQQKLKFEKLREANAKLFHTPPDIATPQQQRCVVNLSHRDMLVQQSQHISTQHSKRHSIHAHKHFLLTWNSFTLHICIYDIVFLFCTVLIIKEGSL